MSVEPIELEWIAHELGDAATLRARGLPRLTFDHVLLTIDQALGADLQKLANLPAEARNAHPLSEAYGFDVATLADRLRALDADGRAWLLAELDRLIE